VQGAGISADYEILEGNPAVRILEYTRRENVDLIVMSSHGRTGLSPWNVSSVTGKVIQHLTVSMMIARAYRPNPETEMLNYRRILVPIDGSQRAEFALSPAVTRQAFHQADLMLVQAVQKPELPRHSPPSRKR
jgi:nucleotide-binding universal stress UspA family protein